MLSDVLWVSSRSEVFCGCHITNLKLAAINLINSASCVVLAAAGVG